MSGAYFGGILTKNFGIDRGTIHPSVNLPVSPAAHFVIMAHAQIVTQLMCYDENGCEAC